MEKIQSILIELENYLAFEYNKNKVRRVINFIGSEQVSKNKLKKQIENMTTEIERLKEIEFMYNELCK